jgi:hypothetical protein
MVRSVAGCLAGNCRQGANCWWPFMSWATLNRRPHADGQPQQARQVDQAVIDTAEFHRETLGVHV